MNLIALKMLFGDRAKYLGLILGIAFSTLLICQQLSIFIGLLNRAASVIDDAREVDVWVSDPSVSTIDITFALRDTELSRVRGVEGVAWAAPFFRAQAAVRTPAGALENALVIGVDDISLAGIPQTFIHGRASDLFLPDAIMMDPQGFALLFPAVEYRPGLELEINDRRAVIVGIVDSSKAFSSNLIIYTRYSQATRYTNNGRNRLSYILVRALDGQEPALVAARIAQETGLKARTRAEVRWDTISYILENTGIPISFGTVVTLGVLVGIAIVSLTFNQFIIENIKQYAALKAIGVSNRTLLVMTLLQGLTVAAIGYGFGLGAAAMFFYYVPPQADGLRGFFLPWQVASLVAVIALMIVLISSVVSLRKVLSVAPADVFRS